MEEAYIAFTDFVIYASAFLAATALFFYRKLDQELKIFVAYLVMSGCIDLAANYLSEIYGSNLFIIHIFVILEIGFLGLFFKKVFEKLGSKFPIAPISIIVAIMCIGNTLFIQPIDIFNSYAATLVSLALIIFCVLTFYLLLDKQKDEYAVIKGIVAGILIYQMPTFLVLSSANVTMHLSSEEVVILWFTRAALMLIAKFIFLYFLYRAYRSAKTKMI